MPGTSQESKLEGSAAAAELPVGPSDREVVEVLRRMASAEAHLNQARVEALARQRKAHNVDLVRDRVVGDAHAEVVLARDAQQAFPRSRKAARELRSALARESAALELHGFTSWEQYEERDLGGDETDVRLVLAEREHESATEAWRLVQAAFTPTVIIDLTGESARVIS